jgi:hypothetical protein
MIEDNTLGRLNNSLAGILKLNLRRYAIITENMQIAKSIIKIIQRGVLFLKAIFININFKHSKIIGFFQMKILIKQKNITDYSLSVLRIYTFVLYLEIIDIR